MPEIINQRLSALRWVEDLPYGVSVNRFVSVAVGRRPTLRQFVLVGRRATLQINLDTNPAIRYRNNRPNQSATAPILHHDEKMNTPNLALVWHNRVSQD